MKKLIGIITMLVVSACLLVGCGVKEDALVAVNDQNPMSKITIHFDAKGDKVVKVREVLEMDATSVPGGADTVMPTIKDQVKTLGDTKGVTAKVEKKSNNKIVVNMDIDINEDTIKDLKNKNLLPIKEYDVDKFTVESAKKSMESQGFKVKEAK